MRTNSLAQQCRDEHTALQNLKDALRLTLEWQAPSVKRARKLASLAFIIRALQRHLEQQLALEEFDGYMSHVHDAKPNLVRRTEQLRADHDFFRHTLRKLLPNVEQVCPNDEHHFEHLCDELDQLLKRIEQHDQAEATLLYEALLTDEGGEG